MDETCASFLTRTLEVWQPRTSRTLTEEDARQIEENVSGFFCLLMRWSEEEKLSGARSEQPRRQPECKEVLVSQRSDCP